MSACSTSGDPVMAASVNVVRNRSWAIDTGSTSFSWTLGSGPVASANTYGVWGRMVNVCCMKVGFVACATNETSISPPALGIVPGGSQVGMEWRMIATGVSCGNLLAVWSRAGQPLEESLDVPVDGGGDEPAEI